MSAILERDWTTAAGLRAVCLILLLEGYKKHRCGYVGVPKSHPLFGVEYNEEVDLPQDVFDAQPLGKKGAILAFTAGVIDGVAGDRVRKSVDVLIDVHGGVTFAGRPLLLKDSPEWWFGFDCSHCDDGEIEPNPRWADIYIGRHVWTLDEVSAECESMAEQITKHFPLLPCNP